MKTPIFGRALACLWASGQLVGCASLSTDGLPGCDGRERRPANPWGSVLDVPPGSVARSDLSPTSLAPLPSPTLAPPASTPSASDRPLNSEGC